MTDHAALAANAQVDHMTQGGDYMSLWERWNASVEHISPSRRGAHGRVPHGSFQLRVQWTWKSFLLWPRPFPGVTPAAATVLLMGMLGCGMPQAMQDSATVHDVHIGQDITPRMLFARKGDQIRWHNLLPSPVQIGILGTRWQDHVICEKGFKRFGQLEDLVTIQPQEHVSLCFSKVGTVQYNVWLDPKNLTGSMSPTATIRID